MGKLTALLRGAVNKCSGVMACNGGARDENGAYPFIGIGQDGGYYSADTRETRYTKGNETG